MLRRSTNAKQSSQHHDQSSNEEDSFNWRRRKNNNNNKTTFYLVSYNLRSTYTWDNFDTFLAQRLSVNEIKIRLICEKFHNFGTPFSPTLGQYFDNFIHSVWNETSKCRTLCVMVKSTFNNDQYNNFNVSESVCS